MTERLLPQFNTPFHELIMENLAGKEITQTNIGVIAISGTIGSGSSSISSELLSYIRRTMKIPSEFFSSGDEMKKIYTMTTGRENMDGHFERDPRVDRQVDKQLGARMIDLASQNSLVVTKGRLAPYVAKQLQFASEDMRILLPSKIITVFMTADENVRYYRKYLQAKKQDPTLIEEDYYKRLEERKKGEINAFWTAYPELSGVNPYNVNFQSRGKPVYDLVYDTTSHEAVDIALDIVNNTKVKSMLINVGLKA